MKKLIYLIIVSILLLITGCTAKEVINEKEAQRFNKDKSSTIIHKSENILKDRYESPKGFERISVEENSFGEFLRNSELKPYGEKVKYYNGKTKPSNGIYNSVLNVDIGDRDLHQCADAIMLLKAEYLYKNRRYDEINFNFVNGFKAEYSKWLEGYRINISDNETSWYKQEEYDDSYENFRKFMDIVFAYSSTLSLEKESEYVDIEDIQIGDIFIVGGSPGHAVIVMDMAENKNTNEKVFMLAQSYMPAQETQILINPNDKYLSPWYSTNYGNKLKTPEWTFEKGTLKRIL